MYRFINKLRLIKDNIDVKIINREYFLLDESDSGKYALYKETNKVSDKKYAACGVIDNMTILLREPERNGAMINDLIIGDEIKTDISRVGVINELIKSKRLFSTALEKLKDRHFEQLVDNKLMGYYNTTANKIKDKAIVIYIQIY